MSTGSLTAADVLRRYKEEGLPAFEGIALFDVNQTGLFGERPLDVAAVRGDVAEIAALLKGGADINAKGELGCTALHEAVSQGHFEAVAFLLENGADVTIVNDFDMTPLAIAKERGVPQIVEALEAAAVRP